MLYSHVLIKSLLWCKHEPNPFVFRFSYIFWNPNLKVQEIGFNECQFQPKLEHNIRIIGPAPRILSDKSQGHRFLLRVTWQNVTWLKVTRFSATWLKVTHSLHVLHTRDPYSPEGGGGGGWPRFCMAETDTICADDIEAIVCSTLSFEVWS